MSRKNGFKCAESRLRPLSASNLFRTLGKEYHSQAGLKKLTPHFIMHRLPQSRAPWFTALAKLIHQRSLKINYIFGDTSHGCGTDFLN